MGDKEHKEEDLSEKEMTEFEIETVIKNMQRDRKLRRRTEIVEAKDNEGGPPRKKKRKWKVNFNREEKRKYENIEEKNEENPEEKAEEKTEKKTEDYPTINPKRRKVLTHKIELECDKSVNKSVTTVQENRPHLEKNISSYDVSNFVNYYKNQTQLCKSFEFLQKLENTSQRTTGEITNNIHISSGMENYSQTGIFIFGAVVGGQGVGGGINKNKAKQTSAQKNKTIMKHKLTFRTKPIRDYFKSERTKNESGDRTTSGGGNKSNL